MHVDSVLGSLRLSHSDGGTVARVLHCYRLVRSLCCNCYRPVHILCSFCLVILTLSRAIFLYLLAAAGGASKLDFIGMQCAPQ
eukprot:2805448-Amphidinium_carterae.3